MPYKIELLKTILEYLERYENNHKKADLPEFLLFLNEQVFQDKSGAAKIVFEKENYLNYKDYKDIEFSILLTGLFRFAKHYLKKTFTKTGFNTIDEFGFLASLLKESALLKNELINMHHLEISSGTEIIKRLIKNKLIEEYDDPNDGRAKRIKLSDKGRSEIIGAFDEMYCVSKIIRGNISDDELNIVLKSLRKLTYFHNDIWNNDKNTSLKEVSEKYIETN